MVLSNVVVKNSEGLWPLGPGNPRTTLVLKDIELAHSRGSLL